MSIRINIVEMAEGNPGAISLLIHLLNNNKIDILSKILNTNITGYKIWVLYKDLANENFDQMELICKNVPDDILLKACTYEDYSGRKLIKSYINE